MLKPINTMVANVDLLSRPDFFKLLMHIFQLQLQIEISLNAANLHLTEKVKLS